MKFSTSLISLLFCFGTAVSKKHGALRALRHHEDGLTAIGKIRTECMEYFTDMDVDEDDVLSLDDLKTVVTYLMTEVGADEAEVREFADDLSATDVDNDGQIDKAEFMNACTVQEDTETVTDTDTKMKNVDRAKKQLIKAAKKKEAAKMKEAALKREQQKEAARMEYAAKKNAKEAALKREEQKEAARMEHAAKKKEAAKMKEAVLKRAAQKKVKEAALQREEQKEAARMEHAALQKKAAALDKKTALKEATKETAKEAAPDEGGATAAAATTATTATTTTTTQEKSAATVTDHKYSQADIDNIDECQGYFRKMDIDQDGVLSLDDLETVIAAKVKAGIVDEAELRLFVDDMGKVDVNNDEQIDEREFMSACLNN